jgi:hypothetical protein
MIALLYCERNFAIAFLIGIFLAWRKNWQAASYLLITVIGDHAMLSMALIIALALHIFYLYCKF